jgi:TetR/AcrR family transcriptional repressor of nem operon
MLQKGYTNTGIQEVLSTLGVPKGSFYHYFASKEDFAVEIIRHFDQNYSANLLRTLRNQQESPMQRLKTYCETGKTMLEASACTKGCLIGKLSQEMSEQSETLRKELSIVMHKHRDMFAACIEEGQKAGEIRQDCPALKLAGLFLSSWGGAVMNAKTLKNTGPVDDFLDLMFNKILKA